MRNILRQHLLATYPINTDYTSISYTEDINPDVMRGEWLENETSFIHKVGVLTAIDANKCDWVYVVVGTQRREHSDVQIVGTFHFPKGENDDIGRVIKRMTHLLEIMHPVFEGTV